MESYQIKWKISALKDLRAIRKDFIPKIIEVVESLAINPFPIGTKKLAGSEGIFRIRVGDYRVIYEILKTELIIQIIRVRHRKDVYRQS
jgi:mRNA interferase RelE/StbE